MVTFVVIGPCMLYVLLDDGDELTPVFEQSVEAYVGFDLRKECGDIYLKDQILSFDSKIMSYDNTYPINREISYDRN
jgi:hypothetical protein